jgi:vitamin B12 transporter
MSHPHPCKPVLLAALVWPSLCVAVAEPTSGAEAAADTVELDSITVFSTRVALQEPTGTFAAPVSVLRFEPQVDVQARGFAEGQADVSIRGGTFENTGFSVGALPIYDPQTGHYSAELPVSPYMLGAPEVRVGAEQAATGFNATAGGVAYGWRPVRTGGAVSGGFGADELVRGELYAGFVAAEKIAGFSVGGDVSAAASEGDGTVTGADHEFARYNGRVQLVNATSQTDFFAGSQTKFFGLPNLYARGNNPETEDILSRLFLMNHRSALSQDGDYVQFGAYYRDTQDDYEYNRFNPGQFNPYEHQTIVRGAAIDARVTVADATAVLASAGVVDDDLDSTSLVIGPTNGRFMSRTQTYIGLRGEQTFALAEHRDVVATLGARLDDSNRDGSEVSPTAMVELRQPTKTLERVYVSYSETTQLPTYQALNASSVGGLFRGDRDLPRATAANFETGVNVAGKVWTLQASVFFRQDRSQLDYVFTTPVSARSAVAVDIDTFGTELFVRREWQRFDLLVGYTYLNKSDDYDLPNGGSFYALNYAEHRFTAGAIARLGAGFELRMDNEYRHQAENSLRRFGRDNIDSALGLFYRVPGVRGLTLSAQADNLWDTAYEEVPLVPASRHAWSVGATYVW